MKMIPVRYQKWKCSECIRACFCEMIVPLYPDQCLLTNNPKFISWIKCGDEFDIYFDPKYGAQSPQ